MNKIIQAIKIEQKKAGIPDKEYRNMLRQIAGVSSARDLDEKAGKAVLKAIRTKEAALHGRSFRQPQTAQERKIWAMWYELREMLPKEERTFQYLLGFCRRVSGEPNAGNLGGFNKPQLHKIIEALKQRIDQEYEAIRQGELNWEEQNVEPDSDIPF